MTRVEMAALYPYREGESAGHWTDRVLTHSREHQVNRQCSIGWHEECSDPAGEQCMCLCHDDNFTTWTVEGHPEGGEQVITRAEQGRQNWPPVKGEPPGTWAVWSIASSEEDAKARALERMKLITIN